MMDPDKMTAEMCRLYRIEDLTLREIAARFGISYQAVYQRVSSVGLLLRPNHSPPRVIDRETLVRLYVDERLSVYKIAEKLKAANKTIISEMRRHRIKRRPRASELRRYPELDGLKVGESLEVSRPNVRNPYVAYYGAAAVRGIRVSVRSIGKDRLKITRKG